MIDRSGFSRSNIPALVFFLLACLLPLAAASGIQSELQAVLLTMGLNVLLFIMVIVFFRREGINWKKVGLGRKAWRNSFPLFLGWWLLLTLIDLVGRKFLGTSGSDVSPSEELVWTPLVVLEFIKAWVFVGFAEEFAFRGYLHNKLAAVMPGKWVGIGLTALLFGLWHIPASIIMRNTSILQAIPGALGFGLFSFLFLNLPYEWTGLLPFLCLFHGWSDFPLLLTFQPPSPVGAVAGYALLLVTVGLWIWLQRRRLSGNA
jgi:uncharacterized protein